MLVAFNDSPSCRGFTWKVNDVDTLAKLVAHLLMGQYLHAENLLAGRPIQQTAAAKAAYLRIIRELTQPSDVTHRDGWLFQMISWIAARVKEPDVLARAPQPRPADKGFDGILVPLRHDGSTRCVVVCEDKATEQPRRMIRDEVWPSIQTLETGARDNELVSEVTTLLMTAMARPAAEEAVRRIIWKRARRYRVSVTADSSRAERLRRRALFKGYRSVARGNCVRRRGEMLILDDLRPWMDEFATRVAKHLRDMKRRV
jgi:hypothetical protein